MRITSLCIIFITFVIFLLGSLSGCAYRIATPYQIPGGIVIQTGTNTAKLVRSQLSIHKYVNHAIQQDLAWPIYKQSKNTLTLNIQKDSIEESSRDALRASNRWQITLRCQVLFTSPYLNNGKSERLFSATASISTLSDEGIGIERASENIGDQIRAWLETLPYVQQ